VIRLIIFAFSLILILVPIISAQDPADPGLPDSLIIGSAEVPYPTGESCYVDIPVYFVTDDSVPSFFLPLKWHSADCRIYPVAVTWHGVFIEWDEAFDAIYADQHWIRIIGFHDLDSGDVKPPLYTDYQRFQGLTITFYIESEAIEQICTIDTLIFSRCFRLYFSCMHGVDDFIPVVQTGSITVGDGVGIDDLTESPVPDKYRLSQNFPNPFNPDTRMEFQIPEPGHVSLEIYNIIGQKVKTLVSEYKSPGYYQVSWNGTNDYNQVVPSGIYFYRLDTGAYSETRKMVMLK
jgi:hypothetical protein